MWFNIINLAALRGTSTNAVDKNCSCFSVNQNLADCAVGQQLAIAVGQPVIRPALMAL